MSYHELPEGVPSPVVTHVHPYPTRYHGGIWTRPVFGLPWVRTPHAVFRPSQMAIKGVGAIDPTFRPLRRSELRGMGDLLWNTSSGVFRRPKVDGGGIFNDVRGLGQSASDAGIFFTAAALAGGLVYFMLKRQKAQGT